MLYYCPSKDMEPDILNKALEKLLSQLHQVRMGLENTKPVTEADCKGAQEQSKPLNVFPMYLTRFGKIKFLFLNAVFWVDAMSCNFAPKLTSRTLLISFVFTKH